MAQFKQIETSDRTSMLESDSQEYGMVDGIVVKPNLG